MTKKVKQITKEIVELDSLQFLAQAYEEIASTRMKKSRDTVLSKRTFIDEIRSIFDEVRTAYAKKVVELAKQKKGTRKVTFLAHNGKTVALFLSANTGLYGEIVKKTFNLFMQEVLASDVEITIVGRQGLSLFLQEAHDKPYTYFDLPDYTPSSDQMLKIVNHVVQYEEIHAYHGKFINVVTQAPTVISISAEIDLTNVKSDKAQSLYIFEPSLEKILVFFEKEIFASIFEQMVSESELAKASSRVIAMDKASANIKEYLIRLRIEKIKAKHRQLNKAQINTLGSIMKYY